MALISKPSSKGFLIVLAIWLTVALLLFIFNVFVKSFDTTTTFSDQDQNNSNLQHIDNNQNTDQQSKEQVIQTQLPQANMNTPDGVVVLFIQSLGNRNFSDAYNLMAEKRRGTYSQFSSTNGYGGITSTRIFQCDDYGIVNGKYQVYIDYESIDPTNKSGRIKQYFYLVDYRTSYLISDIKNISMDWY